MSKNITPECSEIDELEYLNSLVNERMKRMEQVHWEREAERDHQRVMHERRLNARVRMISIIMLYATMVVALIVLAYTKVVVWWLCMSVAAPLALCGAFRAGYYYRESEI